MTSNNLPKILAARNIAPAEFARRIRKSRSFVCRLLSGQQRASAETIDDILDFLDLTYEECFRPRRRARRSRKVAEPNADLATTKEGR